MSALLREAPVQIWPTICSNFKTRDRM